MDREPPRPGVPPGAERQDRALGARLVRRLLGRGRVRRPADRELGCGEILKREPTNEFALTERAVLRSSKGDLKGALADYDALLSRTPDANAFRGRALLRALGGNRAGALEDLAAARKLKPEDPYLALWTVGLGGDPACLDAVPLKDDWISNVVRLYAGKLTRDELLAAAEKAATPRERDEHLCEAHGYLALREDRDGDVAAARADYERCLATKVTSFIEYAYAYGRLPALPK